MSGPNPYEPPTVISYDLERLQESRRFWRTIVVRAISGGLGFAGVYAFPVAVSLGGKGAIVGCLFAISLGFLFPTLGVYLTSRAAPKSGFIGFDILLAGIAISVMYAICRYLFPWFPNMLLL
jgi:hypothetical protein